MADTEITWAGLTLGGDSDYSVLSITGWEELAGLTDMSAARVRGHGDHLGDQFSQARIVTVTGEIVDSVDRDSLARALESVTSVRSGLQDLTIELFGQALTAQGRIVQRALTIGQEYDFGAVPFALQWRCPDPLRYGPAVTTSTGLPTTSGGLVYPLTYPLSYGSAGSSGQLTLTNSGTADAPILFVVSGSLPNGFEISAAGQRLTYPAAVPSGQPVTIDTGSGSVTVEGTADRRTTLTNADWMQVPAMSSLTVQFTSLGGTYDPAANLTASYRPAYW